MKTSTKKTVKVVVAFMAAMFTILILMIFCKPTYTVGDSEPAMVTTTTTILTTETTFLETTETTTETTTSTNKSGSTIIKSDTATMVKNTTVSSQKTKTQSHQTPTNKTTQTTQSHQIPTNKTTQTTTSVTTTSPTTTDMPVEIETYVIYKPSTHYIHLNTCHWAEGDIYTIENTEGIEARRCSECNPSMEIITTYVEPIPALPALPITEYERILLCNVVAREYGSDYVPTAEKAKVVAVVMNRVRDSRFPNDIYSVLTQPYQFSGYVAYNTYTSNVTTDVIAAVDYYFNHASEFSTSILYFWGDGKWNYFS